MKLYSIRKNGQKYTGNIDFEMHLDEATGNLFYSWKPIAYNGSPAIFIYLVNAILILRYERSQFCAEMERVQKIGKDLK